LVIEPAESRARIGRSPSLGPPGNLYSPTIPSPLRLVSLPEQTDQEEAPEQVVEKGKIARTDTVMEIVDTPPANTTVEVGSTAADKENLKPVDPKAEAWEVAVSSLPTFAFDGLATSNGLFNKTGAQAGEARRLAVDQLPKFDLHIFVNSASTIPSISPVTVAQFAMPFNNDKSEWICDTCMLRNPPTALKKCTICEADRPVTAASASLAPSLAPAPVAFNWSAAGFAPKTVAAGSWTCSTCGLSNTADATKCTVCDAAKS